MTGSTVSKVLHILPSGQYKLKVVGESYNVSALLAIAPQNASVPIVTMCTAQLVPEPSNPSDPNAIGVFIENQKVGYLSREDAVRLRELAGRGGHANRHLACEAVVSGGCDFGSGATFHCVELDVDLDSDMLITGPLTNPSRDRATLSTSAEILLDSNSEIIIRFPFLRYDTIGLAQDCAEVTPWRSRDGQSVHFFAAGTTGGAGRLGVIEERDFPGLLDRIELMDIVAVHRTGAHSLELRAAMEADPRLDFRAGGTANLLVLEAQASDGVLSEIAALAFTASLPSGTLQSEGPAHIWLAAEDDAQLSQLRELALLLDGADVIVTNDARRTISILRTTLTIDRGSRPLWRCASSRWQGLLPSIGVEAHRGYTAADAAETPTTSAGALLRKCGELAQFVFTHRGKTLKSKTYLAELMA